MISSRKKSILGLGIVGFLILFAIAYIFLPPFFDSRYEVSLGSVVMAVAVVPEEPDIPVVTHIQTPDAVKAIYMSSWVAGDKGLRKKLVDLIDRTELNAVVVDIKDYTGRIAFPIHDPIIEALDPSDNRIPDISHFLQELHAKGIYVIGRIASFQDPYIVKQWPEDAVKTANGKTTWKDHKGISWMDASSKQTWDYLVAIGKGSYELGFDELNYDYIRFPSDGNMKDISYPISGTKDRSDVMESFFAYLHEHLSPTGVKLSADLFGMTTTHSFDLNIGQVLSKALPYFDFVAPMVYPSHYPAGFLDFKNPSDKPYEVVHYAMKIGAEKALAASSSPLKLRPWLQDFNLGATYTPEMVRAQIKATYDAGLTSWMLWNASNRYTEAALLKEER